MNLLMLLLKLPLQMLLRIDIIVLLVDGFKTTSILKLMLISFLSVNFTKQQNLVLVIVVKNVIPHMLFLEQELLLMELNVILVLLLETVKLPLLQQTVVSVSIIHSVL